jgi:hypothetical protein
MGSKITADGFGEVGAVLAGFAGQDGGAAKAVEDAGNAAYWNCFPTIANLARTGHENGLRVSEKECW